MSAGQPPPLIGGFFPGWEGAGGGKNAPPPQDYRAANAAQTRANRPDQTNAFGTSSSWVMGPDGQLRQVNSFGGGLGAANTNLQNQLAQATSSPLDFSGAPALQFGEDARKAATDASYGQLTSRLDPMWASREEAERVRLANQGLDPGSQAFATAMDDFNRGRNDAYQGALNSSIGLGLNAADQMFNQSNVARQSSIADMIRGKTLPLQMLQGLGQFTGQSGFGADQGLQAAGMQGAQDLQRYQMQQENSNDFIGGLFDALGSIVPGLGAVGSILKLLRGGGGDSSSGRIGAGELG